VLVVDRSARVLYANRAAQDTLRDASALRTERDVLAGRRPADTAALHALIAGAGGAIGLPSYGRMPLGIGVVLRPAGELPFEDEQVFVFVSDPERQTIPPIERLQSKRPVRGGPLELLEGPRRRRKAHYVEMRRIEIARGRFRQQRKVCASGTGNRHPFGKFKTAKALRPRVAVEAERYSFRGGHRSGRQRIGIG
jgi:hypothetical protein